MLFQPSFPLFDASTFSPESVGGTTPSGSPDGPKNCPYGPPPSHANLSATQAKEQGLLIPDTSFQPSTGSSASAALQSLLVNKLQVQREFCGSILYRHVWKVKATPSRRLYYQLVALGPHTDAGANSGWPTPTCQDNAQVVGQYRTNGTTLAGWATVSAVDSVGSHGGGQGASLRTQTHGVSKTANGLHARTGKQGALNPDLCRWLMGFPPEWCESAVMAMQSFRK